MIQTLHSQTKESNNEVASPKTTANKAVAVYIFLGMCVVVGAIIVAMGLWYQTKILENRIFALEQLVSEILGPTQRQTDILAYFKTLEVSKTELKPAEPSVGLEAAPVTVVMYEDFQCPYCHEFQTTVFPELKKDYIDTGNVRFVHRDYAFLGPESTAAAGAALCAADQNKFWEYRETLYQNQGAENAGTFSSGNLIGFAAIAGLDATRFSQCLEQQKYNSIVAENTNQASSLGINSTPTLVINGRKIEGVIAYPDLVKIISYLLETNGN